MGDTVHLSRRVEELRRAFDDSFAAPWPTPEAHDRERMLALRVFKDTYLVRLAEVSGLAGVRSIVPVPSEAPALLGVTAFRGRIVPLFSLALLLGYPAEGDPPRWFVLVAEETPRRASFREEPVGLAFHDLEGQVLLSPSDICPIEAQRARPHLQQAVRSGTELRPVISIPFLMRGQDLSGRANGPSKEHIR